MNESDAKIIEVCGGGLPTRRVSINKSITELVIPTPSPDGHGGHGQVSFQPSGLKSDDGVELWTPQTPVRA